MYISSSGADWPESASVPLSGFAALVGSEVDVPAELETGVSVELLSPGASLAGRNNDQTQNAIITTPSIAMPAIFHLRFSFCVLKGISKNNQRCVPRIRSAGNKGVLCNDAVCLSMTSTEVAENMPCGQSMRRFVFRFLHPGMNWIR